MNSLGNSFVRPALAKKLRVLLLRIRTYDTLWLFVVFPLALIPGSEKVYALLMQIGKRKGA